jgi:hypothetical protein
MIRNRHYTFVGVLGLIAALIAPQANAQQETARTNGSKSAPAAAEIGAWITQLNDDRYLLRERATRQLFDAGAAALDPLLAAADSDQPEPADRAIWILRRLSTSKELSLRRQALERLAELKKRPQVAAAAREMLAEIRHQEALQAIEQLGGRFVEGEYLSQLGHRIGGRLVLDERWRGGDAGLVNLQYLNNLNHIIIVGTEITAEGLKQLQHCESLEELWLYGTKLDAQELPKIRKLLRENVVVDYRRGALLGVSSAAPDLTGPAIVRTVEPGSAAAAAGIQPNDIIHKFEGSAIPNFRTLTQKIGDCRPGDEVTLEILRDDKAMEFKVKLGQWKTVE